MAVNAVGAGYHVEADGWDDTNHTVHPGAPEYCDGLDNDCDALVDEGVTFTVDTALDRDGFGEPASSSQTCAIDQSTQSLNGDDCDDRNACDHPAAMEIPLDGIDNECSGEMPLNGW